MNELVCERLVPFESAPNFRDLGGYPITHGGTTRWGIVFRAGRLDSMTAADLERFASLGVATVFDLRNADERANLPDAVESQHVPLVSRMLRNAAPPDFASVVDYDDGVEFMRRLYSQLLEFAGPEIGTVVAALAEPDQRPVLFHCTAGKDRTGIVAAVILELLGVERESVLDDFELTARFHHPEHTAEAVANMMEHGVGPEAAAGAMGSSRSSMASALDELDRRYGGAERYLVEHAGVTAEQIARLRSQLVDR